MGTRSIVAAETERGTVGVYVHWDGYPEGRIPVLQALVQRDGIAKVVATIIGQPHGWSTLNENEIEPQQPGINGSDRFTTVPGYGVQYQPAPIQGNEKHWTPEDEPGSYGDEYIYMFRANGSLWWADSYAEGVSSFADLTWTPAESK